MCDSINCDRLESRIAKNDLIDALAPTGRPPDAASTSVASNLAEDPESAPETEWSLSVPERFEIVLVHPVRMVSDSRVVAQVPWQFVELSLSCKPSIRSPT